MKYVPGVPENKTLQHLIRDTQSLFESSRPLYWKESPMYSHLGELLERLKAGEIDCQRVELAIGEAAWQR